MSSESWWMNAPTVSADNSEQIPGGTNWAERPPRVSGSEAWPGRLTSSRNGQTLEADSWTHTTFPRPHCLGPLSRVQVYLSISVSRQGRKLLVPWVGPDSVRPSTVLWSPVKAGRKPQKGQRSLLKTYTVFGNGLGLYRRPIRALTFYIIVIHFVFVFVFFLRQKGFH